MTGAGGVREGREVDSWKQVLVSVAVGVPVGVLAARWPPPALWPLVTWSATVAAYLVWVWRTSWPCDAERTRRLAPREGPSRRGTDIFLGVASVISFGAVAAAVAGSTSGQVGTRALTIALGLLTIVQSGG